MPLPNFMIIGAKKAATTSLYEYLRQHPAAFLPDLKEPNYFAYEPDNPAFAHYTRLSFPIRTELEYRALFADVTTEIAIGEASVGYLESPTAPAKIWAVIPDNRMIVSLRDPVDRAYSGYLMSVRNGEEHRSLLDVIHATRTQMVERSYARSLERWFGVFPRSQFKILLYEEIRRQPLDVTRTLYEYLGVDPAFVPDITMRFNRGGVPKNETQQRLVTRIRRLRRFRGHVPNWMRSRFTAFANANLAPAPPIPDDARDLLYEIYLPEIERLENLLELDLTTWKSPQPVTKA